MYKIEVKDVAPMTFVALAYQGPYREIVIAFDQLVKVAGPRVLISDETTFVAAYNDDPALVPDADLRCHAGFVVPHPLSVAPPLELMTHDGGPCAVMVHRGPYSDLPAAYDHLMRLWLPHSGWDRSDAAIMEIYLNKPVDVLPEHLLTEIRVPLKKLSPEV